MFQKVYACALPFLGVSKKIKKEWCTLPESFQGLSLLFFPLVALLEKLSFLLGNWGFHGLAHSDALAMAFDNFLMEVGLYGSPLLWSYADYGSLPMDASWFRNLWELVDYFNVDLLLQEADLVQGVREGDWSLISKFFCLGCRGKQLVANIVWRFCNLLHVSDIVKCNGVTLDEFVVSDSTEVLVFHVFFCKEPTAANFRLWEEAIASLLSGSAILPCYLGWYLCPPHFPRSWFTTEPPTFLYRVHDEPAVPTYDVFHLLPGRVGTRHGH
jgi:hypothetical protein